MLPEGWAFVCQAGPAACLEVGAALPPRRPGVTAPYGPSSLLSLKFAHSPLPLLSLPKLTPAGNKGKPMKPPGTTEDPAAQLFPEGHGEPQAGVEQGETE